MKKYISDPGIILRLLIWLPVYFFSGSFKREVLILLIMSSVSLSACYKNYYQTNTENNAADSEAMNAFKNQNKYFIIHFKDAELELKNIVASDSNIEGDVTKIEDPSHLLYLSPPRQLNKEYKKKYESSVLQEVHIYIAENYFPQKKEHISFPVRSVSRVDIYTKNRGFTIISYVSSTIAAAVGLVIFAYIFQVLFL